MICTLAKMEVVLMSRCVRKTNSNMITTKTKVGVFTPQGNCPTKSELGEANQMIRVDWQSDGSYIYCKWWVHINVNVSFGVDSPLRQQEPSPETEGGLGLVIRLDDLILQLRDNAGSDDRLRVHYGGNIRTYSGDGPAQPLVVVSDYVWFELVTFKRESVEEGSGVVDSPRYIRNGLTLQSVLNLNTSINASSVADGKSNINLSNAQSGRDGGKSVSRLSLSFTTYPRHTVPPEVEAGVYNCSQPYRVPLELQCDGFAQCLAAEDELDYNCTYTHLGCEDGWVAGESFCLKFVWPATSISPDEARLECGQRYKAELGSLPHPDARRLAAILLVKYNHDELIVGLERIQVSASGLHLQYRFLWQWSQAGTEFDGPSPKATDSDARCATLTSGNQLRSVNCGHLARFGYVCSRPNPQRMPHAKRTSLELDPPLIVKFREVLKNCHSGHFVNPIHPCEFDVEEDTGFPPMLCRNGRRVQYMMTCDGYDDCGDGSDERSCDDVGTGPMMRTMFMCTRELELVDITLRCNGVPDCHDASDEENCEACSKGTVPCADLGCMPCGTPVCPLPEGATEQLTVQSGSKSRQVDIDGFGMMTLGEMDARYTCPRTHFLCGWTTVKYCIPSFLIGNGQHDCPAVVGVNSSADEPSGVVVCPGHYRCYRHNICIHPTYFCDGVYHCPLKDDERYCDLPCPRNCTCVGLAYRCSQMFDPADHAHVRLLDLSGARQPSLDNLHYMGYLAFLNLSGCGLTHFPEHLTHLRQLDFSFNNLARLVLDPRTFPLIDIIKLSLSGLTEITIRQGLDHLHELDLRGNHLKKLTLVKNSASVLEVLDLSTNGLSEVSLFGLEHLKRLDLSANNINGGEFTCDQNNITTLEFLNLSSCGLHSVKLEGLQHLHMLDISSNKLTTLSDVTLRGLRHLLHLNLSHNHLLPSLDAAFQIFVKNSGIVALQTLVLRNTRLRYIEADPFVGMTSRPHLDTTGNEILSVDMSMFTHWTSKLSVFQTGNISTCCAYYKRYNETATSCRTSTEVVYPEQCSATVMDGGGGNRIAQDRNTTPRTCDVGWLSFESLCLRFVFPILKMSTSTAINECRGRFGAGLVALPTQAAREVAARFLQLSGYQQLIVGLEKVSAGTVTSGLAHLYRVLWRWRQAGVEFDVPRVQTDGVTRDCAVFDGHSLRPVQCSAEEKYAYVCSKPVSGHPLLASRTTLSLSPPSVPVRKFPATVCSDASFVHTFHPCRPAVTGEGPIIRYSPLLTGDGSAPSYSLLMHCRNGRRVHYTMTCDGHDDCGDYTDEDNCRDVRPGPLQSLFACTRQPELVDITSRCNGIPDCHDTSDEENCDVCSDAMLTCGTYGCLPGKYNESIWLMCDIVRPNRKGRVSPLRFGRSVHNNVNPIVHRSTNTVNITGGCNHTEVNSSQCSYVKVADLDAYGFPSLSSAFDCPETHFRCTGGYCIPSFLINNGVSDCPLSVAEDEALSSLICLGYYRCYKSGVCLHPEYLCDGVYHCPLKDDERYCHLSCPEHCICQGHAYRCSAMFDPADYLHVRYLDLSGTPRPPLHTLYYMGYLSFLNLSSCHVTNASLVDLVHLRVLDVSHNLITSLTDIVLGEMPLLAYFNISHNPLTTFLVTQLSGYLAAAKMNRLLSLSFGAAGIEYIEEYSFVNMSSLLHLDIRGNVIRGINQGMFVGLTQLQVLETDDPRLCCPYFYLYPNTSMDCQTPIDELSSCSDLLRSDFFRVFLWTLSIMAILGNVGVVVYRMFLEAQGTSPGFRVLVSNLCVSDLMMGVYMLMIGAADAHYSGQYIWRQEAWTGSALCQAAGFLSLLSSEVSAFIICLITLDRVLVLRFPLSPHLHLTLKSTLVACGVAWFLGLLVAAIPLFPKDWTFYGQTGVCLPLPITRRPFPGQQYAFAVFVVLNFVLFVLIGLGQLVIFRTIVITATVVNTSRRQQDTAIARRLFLIVLTDFLCWFPIGLMGLLAYRGTPIPGEVNVWAAIFILPVNSAINPFLYTLGLLLEKWLRRRKEQRIRRTLDKLHIDMLSWSEDKVQELIRCGQEVLVWMGAGKKIDVSDTSAYQEEYAQSTTEPYKPSDTTDLGAP